MRFFFIFCDKIKTKIYTLIIQIKAKPICHNQNIIAFIEEKMCGHYLEHDLQYMPWEYRIQEQYHLTFLNQIKPYNELIKNA